MQHKTVIGALDPAAGPVLSVGQLVRVEPERRQGRSQIRALHVEGQVSIRLERRIADEPGEAEPVVADIHRAVLEVDALRHTCHVNAEREGSRRRVCEAECVRYCAEVRTRKVDPQRGA